MMILKVALRNLMRQKKRTIFTGLSMLVGFVLACFFIGWADGTYNHMIDTFTSQRLGHIQIHEQGYLDKPSLYKTIEETDKLTRKIETLSNVRSWAPRIYTAGLASSNEKSAGVQIIGIDPSKEDKTTNFARKIIAGEYFQSDEAQNTEPPPVSSSQDSEKPNQPALLGKELARILKTDIGDSVVIVSQAADGSIANDRYTVRGLVDTGDPATNRSAFYLPLSTAQKLFVLYGQVHEIAVTVTNLHQVEEVTATLRKRLQTIGHADLHVSPWQEFAHEFYMAMQADKGGMYVMLVVVVIVVAITILNTILMSVLERQKEYGVLRAIGTRPGQIIKMVLTETSILAVACIVLGSIIGFFLNLYFTKHGISLAQPIVWGGIELEYMKGELNWKSFYLPSITVLTTALIVCFFPALKAARTEPAKTMRIF